MSKKQKNQKRQQLEQKLNPLTEAQPEAPEVDESETGETEETIVLSDEQFSNLATLLETPAAPTPALIELLQDPKQAPVQAPKERVWDIHDAARQMIVDFKEMWWPSIHKMAHHLGYKNSATESECREIFEKWGAKVK